MMLRAQSRLFSRRYSSEPVKASIKLVAELRKQTEVSLSKAREALSATNNNVSDALKWLEQDHITSGSKRAAKVEGRATPEGMIGVSVLSPGARSSKALSGIRAAMIELNCETDFVGRNDVFGKLAANIAHTAAYLTEPAGPGLNFTPLSLDALNEAPVINPSATSDTQISVGDSIREAISKLGEKVHLRRAVTIVHDPLPDGLGLRVSSYTHGAVNIATNGRVAGLAVLAIKSDRLAKFLADTSFNDDLSKLERSMARQIVGFDTLRIHPRNYQEVDEQALYSQPFAMHGDNTEGLSVSEYLSLWAEQRGLAQDEGVEVLNFAKWTVNGPIDS